MHTRRPFLSCCTIASLLLPLFAMTPVAAAALDGKFLDARGRVCMDAVLAAGAERALDLRGYQVVGTAPIDAARFATIEAIDRCRREADGHPLPSDTIAAASTSGCWSDEFPLPGVNGPVHALAEYNGKPVIGGAFTIAGKTANYIATWNGSSWDYFGSGMNGPVHALAVYNGKLVAGGAFTIAGEVGANRIAVWDGTRWSPLARGVSGTVRDLVVYNGDLIATGDFTVAGQVYANCIARWSGTAWNALGDGLNNSGSLLEVYGTKLVVAGGFTAAGTVIANGVAAWSGTAWSSMGTGLGPSGWVSTLVAHDGLLLAGGEFPEIGINRVPYLAAWDGTNWIEYAGGVSRSVSAMANYGANLVAAFRDVHSAGGNGTIEMWDGASWTLLADTDQISFDIMSEAAGNLLVGGWDADLGSFAAEWNGVEWALIQGPGLDGPVNAMVEYAGDLVIGGEFTQVGAIAAQRIARWDGAQWLPLGSGIGTPYEDWNEVLALEVIGGELFVGGRFQLAGGDSIDALARWNGVHWSPVGGGLQAPYDQPIVSALEVHEEKLFVGGQFASAAGVSTPNVARWDPAYQTWSALGDGLVEDVNALLSFGSLVVAGVNGSWSGSVVRAWDGASWNDLGFDPSYYNKAYALASFNGDLIAGGAFSSDYEGGLRGIARWDGIAWQPMGADDALSHPYGTPTVRALAVHRGQLIAGGSFRMRADASATNLAAWDGTQWAAIESGVGSLNNSNDEVRSLFSWNTSLVVGGSFMHVGDEVSANLAINTCPMPSEAGGGPGWPATLRLRAGSPNPFANVTRIGFDLPRDGLVSVGVFDVSGRQVRSLLHSVTRGPGAQGVEWNGRDDQNRTVPPGTYFIRLETTAGNRTAKVTRVH